MLSRNVLIYFTTELQRRTLQLFAFSLKDRGYLMLGKAESTSPLPEFFAPVEPRYKVFHRVGERFVMPASSVAEPMPSPPRGARSPAHGGSSLRTPEPYPDSRGGGHESRGTQAGSQIHEAQEAALARLPVGVISVDRSYDIHSINSAARRLLSVHGSAIGDDLLHLAREAPYDELRPAIDSAFQKGEPVSTGEFDVEEVTTGELRTLKMTCYPPDPSPPPDASNPPEPAGSAGGTANPGPARTITIIIEEVTEYARTGRELRERLDSASTEVERYKREAEEESERRRGQNAHLVEGNRQLEAANRELRKTVEELRMSSEQYQLSTEEAQASAEEVETLNEELQATNEELETVNEELQATVEELNTTNEDLQTRSAELQEVSRAREREQKQMQRQLQTQLRSLLESVSEPMLVVEPSGRDTLTNEAYRQTFGPDGFVAIYDTVGADSAGAGPPATENPQDRATRGEGFTTELWAKDAGGVKRRYEVTGNQVDDERQRGGLVAFREIPAEHA